MLVVRSESECPRPLEGSVVTIGAYDGVHLGHREVIRRVLDIAAADGLHSAVVTFDRHPASVVRPESAPLLLTDLDQRLDLLATTGVDTTVLVGFDEAASGEEAEDFVRRVLVDCLGARHIVVGSDFHFGRGRRGNVELLTEVGDTEGFTVDALELVDPTGRPAGDGDRVSSTRIRAALDVGDVAEAARLLGRPHQVRGIVEPGDQRGRLLGFPTANVGIADEIRLPDDGVYAAWYRRQDGTVHPAAVSIGRRPTFYEEAARRLVEAHLLGGFDDDLYGEQAHVSFVSRLRGIVAFDGPEALALQLSVDCAEAAAALAGRDPDSGSGAVGAPR